MFLKCAFHPLQQRAAGQTEARHQFDHGKTAASLLRGRLRPSLLIGSRIGHGNTRAVHHFDGPAQPEFGGRDASVKFVGQRLVKLA